MGNVVDFAARSAEIRAARAATEAANDIKTAEAVLGDEDDIPDRDTPEGEELYKALTNIGVTILNEESLRDYKTVMKLVRGMKDRQSGNNKSDNCMMLECMAQALGYTKDIPEDDCFDDLLSKLD